MVSTCYVGGTCWNVTDHVRMIQERRRNITDESQRRRRGDNRRLGDEVGRGDKRRGGGQGK